VSLRGEKVHELNQKLARISDSQRIAELERENARLLELLTSGEHLRQGYVMQFAVHVGELAAEHEAHKHTRDALRAVQWRGHNQVCAICRRTERIGHKPDCIVGNALAEERGE
jgi:hypothetical protein